jgi:hypothetical protein
MQTSLSPVGTVETFRRKSTSNRPYGTKQLFYVGHLPSSELLGYYQAPLRDENAFRTCVQQRGVDTGAKRFSNP